MRARRATPATAALAVACLVGMAAASADPASSADSAWSALPRRADSDLGDPLMQRGREVFDQRCAACHGEIPEQTFGPPFLPPMPGTQALEARYRGALPAMLEERTDLAPEYVEAVVRDGLRSMPFFRPTELSDEDLEALVAYLTADRSTPAAGAAAADRSTPAAGAAAADRSTPAAGAAAADRSTPAAGTAEAAWWWPPGDDRPFPAYVEYPNAAGRLGLVNAGGDVVTDGHPFFEALGTNGRGCVSCHQPADGMSLALSSIRERWEETGGDDPIFAPIDGMDCPHLPRGDAASHSLLLQRGLFRVPLPWPPRDAAGNPVEPEFTLEVVRDPTGCNTHPVYGIDGERREVSVYRRPRPAANLRYVTASKFGVTPFIGKTGMLAATDPDTGRPVNMNMMADARDVTLKAQAQSAAHGHMEVARPLSAEQLARIEAFELQLYAAQAYSTLAGWLNEPGGPSGLGPQAMAAGRDGLLGNNTSNFVFPMEDKWSDLPEGGSEEESARNAFRESVARGHDVFFFRTFWISDAMHINTVGLGNPIKRTCATCHGMHMTGMDTANGWMDLGTTNHPWALEPPESPWAEERPPLPLFKVTCRADLPPHPFLGRTIYTQDPGRALISGKCEDVGAIVIQQFRGLAARAPYFVNGSAATLRELVDFYDRRFNIRFTEQERIDLVNFLSVL